MTTAAAQAWIDEFLRTCVASRHNSELKHGIPTADTYPLPKEPSSANPIRTSEFEKEKEKSESNTNLELFALLHKLIGGQQQNTTTPATPAVPGENKSSWWKYLLSGLGGAAVVAPYLLWLNGFGSETETTDPQRPPVVIQGRSSLLQELQDRGYHLPQSSSQGRQ